jgi:DNA repair exonuclease SbcCD ATPase subunit
MKQAQQIREGRTAMRKMHRTAGLALAAALLAATAPRAQEADAAARLEADLQKARSEMERAKKDVQKAEAEARRTDSLLREENARAAAAEQRAAQDRERREKENASLIAQETQGKINQERASLGRVQNDEDEIKARQKRLALLLAGYCDSVGRRIESGLPWDNEVRLDRVRGLKKDLEAGSATVDEGFARLNAILKDEVKNGDEISMINKPITLKNGEQLNAQVLKIGNQWLAYMDEEGKRFGVLERKHGGAWEWREDPGFEEKNRIKAAIEIKSAKRPPSLALLDLGLALGNPSPEAPAATPAAAKPAAIAAPAAAKPAADSPSAPNGGR